MTLMSVFGPGSYLDFLKPTSSWCIHSQSYARRKLEVILSSFLDKQVVLLSPLFYGIGPKTNLNDLFRDTPAVGGVRTQRSYFFSRLFITPSIMESFKMCLP